MQTVVKPDQAPTAQKRIVDHVYATLAQQMLSVAMPGRWNNNSRPFKTLRTV